MPSSMHGHRRPSRSLKLVLKRRLGVGVGRPEFGAPASRSHITIRRACPSPGEVRQCTTSRARLPRAVTGGKTVPAIRRERTMAAEVAGKSPESVQTDRLAARLARDITGDVLFDRFSRGRYATDASFYQIMPASVVVPKTMDEALRALAIARDEGLKVIPRGGGTSQCGQTINDGLVVDLSKHLNRILSLDVEGRTCTVEPGIVLDDLNRQLRKHGLWF